MSEVAELYNTLWETCPKKLDEETIESFLTALTQASPEVHSLCYGLIRYHQLSKATHRDQVIMMPYGSKQLKKGLKFCFNTLPRELQEIVVHYVLSQRAHSEKSA